MHKQKHTKRKNNKDAKDKIILKEKLNNVLELPKEIVLNVPKISIIGYQSVVIENFKGIVIYENTNIKLNTNIGIIDLEGENLLIREITSEDIIIEGIIKKLELWVK